MAIDKKVVFTLSVDNYAPDLAEITMPYLKAWADKICADFHVITERKFPDMPVTYEKFQIWDLAHNQYGNYDWFIYWDCDTLVHPDFFDVTAALPKDTTCSHGSDFTPNRFRPDSYFLRDGRFFGKGNWCAIFSDWCRDYYHPLDDITLEEAVAHIFPTQDEKNVGITAEHLIDDWLVSRNIARYGLKHGLIPDLLQAYKRGESHLHHQYLMPPRLKCIMNLQVLKSWRVISEPEEDARLTTLLTRWGVDPAQAAHIVAMVKPQPGQPPQIPFEQWHVARWQKVVEWMGVDWAKTI